MIKLYQFKLSHYCEKVRWVLDFKKLPYETINLVPGFHFGKITKLGVDETSVPVIVDGETAVQGSAQILTYLDKKYPDNSLSPKDPDQLQECLDWEEFADEEIAPYLRVCFYYILLMHKKLLISYLTEGTPSYNKILLYFLYPLLKKKMIAKMGLNLSAFEQAKIKLGDNILQVRNYLAEKPYLVGEKFTRADLAMAALIAPVHRLEKFGFVPQGLPSELLKISEELSELSPWVKDVYNKHR